MKRILVCLLGLVVILGADASQARVKGPINFVFHKERISTSLQPDSQVVYTKAASLLASGLAIDTTNWIPVTDAAFNSITRMAGKTTYPESVLGFRIRVYSLSPTTGALSTGPSGMDSVFVTITGSTDVAAGASVALLASTRFTWSSVSSQPITINTLRPTSPPPGMHASPSVGRMVGISNIRILLKYDVSTSLSDQKLWGATLEYMTAPVNPGQ